MKKKKMSKRFELSTFLTDFSGSYHCTTLTNLVGVIYIIFINIANCYIKMSILSKERLILMAILIANPYLFLKN